MGFDMNVEFLRMAFWQIVVVSGPILLTALGIGLFVGIIQAATSINEQTLSFVPKLFVVLITFGLLANLMMVQLSDYFLFIFEQVAQVG
ncbi:flagellar biosynthetic protein FliQ [Alphaproteobacteria bacterium]|jgi:flagellar biosynthetic protein FliQ|nr:flagellar biosynthetic protein FliQ [Alphaproteobacteria bacterium]MDB2497715.1 flagellar biosynthetic protein FliQ [Alphaproteobacteria bacterium]